MSTHSSPGGDDRRALLEHVILAGVLPGVAGAVNASSFLAVGLYTSHVTGLVAHIGDEVAQDRFASAGVAAAFVFSFFLGAVTSAATLDLAAQRPRARYATALLIETGALALFAVLAATLGARHLPIGVVCLLTFAMGLQNALVTRISGAVVRTTHLTGIVTDVGIEVVRLSRWLRRRVRLERRPRRLARVLRVLTAGADWRRLRLHLLIFGSFLTGAVIGPQLFLRFGQRAMWAPCGILTLLALGDIRWGFRGPLPTSPSRARGA